MRSPGAECLDSLKAVLGHLHLRSGIYQQPLQQQPILFLVFHDQNALVGLTRREADQ